jgi:membrane-associated phospholipid phosphatase
LFVQLIPVAPPRMLPGIVDTGLAYNQSVYSHGLAIDQLSAMPSVHVAWAVLIGYYLWQVSPSRWRALGPVHAVLMTVVVVVTGNHFWLDGIVAVGILALCAFGVGQVHRAAARIRVRRAEPAADYQADTSVKTG